MDFRFFWLPCGAYTKPNQLKAATQQKNHRVQQGKKSPMSLYVPKLHLGIKKPVRQKKCLTG
ncbi:MAG: hypothetical protein D3909_01700 [Candidatus Electrothrix sp. ATG1]|nr:hypothetical protein [Candidatus Electrothrix sp. ATG1]